MEGILVFGKASSFAGRRWNEELGQLGKSSATCSQKDGRTRGAAEEAPFFRGTGLATKRCPADFEKGNAR